MAMALTIVRTGSWLYDRQVEMRVDVIALNYDWWYSLAEADNQLEEDEKPMLLGPDGVLYYVRFKDAGKEKEPTWPDSLGHRTLAEAMSYAEQKVVGGVRWNSAT